MPGKTMRRPFEFKKASWDKGFRGICRYAFKRALNGQPPSWPFLISSVQTLGLRPISQTKANRCSEVCACPETYAGWGISAHSIPLFPPYPV